ncbi:MAG: efflux RND transporter periplasmic adaptor subunit [Zymomonas mobilis subsp. pomaceae]|uniref:efflux RND transporter periplasmic adaptor subunit n=1 Tax=Zymomonas mobilis TaxID=542 RepID=UPI0039E9AFED
MTNDHDSDDDFGLTAEDIARARRHRLVIIILGTLAIAFLVTLIAWRAKVTAPVQIIAEPVHVSVVTPTQQSVTGMIIANGHLAPAKETIVMAPNTEGKILKVMVSAGDMVQSGQTLAIIMQTRSDENALEQQVVLESQQADLAIAESEYKRAQAAGDTDLAAILKKDYNDAQQRLKSNPQSTTLKKQALSNVQRVVAPVSGLIISNSAEKGMVVIPNSTELFRIADKGEMQMQASVKEKDLPAISGGASADIKIAGNDNYFSGRISSISPVIDNITHSAVVNILLDYNPILKAGSSAEVRIRTMPIQAFVLPDSAVMSDDGGNYVYVLSEGDVVARHHITLGVKIPDGQWEVLSGLQNQDRVIISSGSMVSPGDRVIVDNK